MEDKNQPLDDLSHIRDLMERSTRFISLSGLSGVAAGVIALAGALVAWFGLHFDQRYFNPDKYFGETMLDQNHPYLFLALDGLVVLILAVLAALWFTSRNARKKGFRLWDQSARRLLIHLSIPLVAGGIFCIILGLHGLGWLWAPVLLLFYGLGLVNASKFTFSEVGYLGIAEVGVGLLAAVLPGYGLLFWAFGFGVLHIVYGIYGWRKYER